MMLMIPVSRLYLSRHFLADIFGGYVLGFLIITLFFVIIYRKNQLNEYLKFSTIRISGDISSILTPIYLFVVPITAAFFISEKFVELTGNWLGINVSFYIAGLMGFVEDKRNLKERIIRVIIGFASIFLLGFLTNLLIENLFYEITAPLLFIKGFAITLFGITGSVTLCKKIKLF